MGGAGGAAGGLLGGILTEGLSWRWILFVNVPVGAVLILGPCGPSGSRAPTRDCGGTSTSRGRSP
jgi:MFS family permease